MEGYVKVAQLMASQDEFAIFRRFKVPNLQKLLYMQAEITHLELELTDLANRDAQHPDREYYTRDWWSLSQGDENDTAQWKKFQELTSKLDAYSESPFQNQIPQFPYQRHFCRRGSTQAKPSRPPLEAQEI